MRDVVVIEFEPEHLVLIHSVRPEMRSVPTVANKDYGEVVKAAGPAWSVLNKQGVILGCGGIGYYWPGNCEAWLMIAEEGENYPVTLHKTARKFLEMFEANMEYRRIQAAVPRDYGFPYGQERAYKWALRLGFKPEFEPDCVLRQWGPDGSDYYRMVRFT